MNVSNFKVKFSIGLNKLEPREMIRTVSTLNKFYNYNHLQGLLLLLLLLLFLVACSSQDLGVLYLGAEAEGLPAVDHRYLQEDDLFLLLLLVSVGIYWR